MWAKEGTCASTQSSARPPLPVENEWLWLNRLGCNWSLKREYKLNGSYRENGGSWKRERKSRLLERLGRMTKHGTEICQSWAASSLFRPVSGEGVPAVYNKEGSVSKEIFKRTESGGGEEELARHTDAPLDSHVLFLKRPFSRRRERFLFRSLFVWTATPYRRSLSWPVGRPLILPTLLLLFLFRKTRRLLPSGYPTVPFCRLKEAGTLNTSTFPF